MKNYGGSSIAGALRRHSRKWTASPLIKHPGLFFCKVTLATDVFYHKNPLLSSPREGGVIFSNPFEGGGGGNRDGGVFDRGAYLT